MTNKSRAQNIRKALQGYKSRPWRNAKYLAHVRSHACAQQDSTCFGPIRSHHHGRGGTSTRCCDSLTVPLCDSHHKRFHLGRHPPGKTFAQVDRKLNLVADTILLQLVDSGSRIMPESTREYSIPYGVF